jgi:hypothetical protein
VKERHSVGMTHSSVKVVVEHIVTAVTSSCILGLIKIIARLIPTE